MTKLRQTGYVGSDTGKGERKTMIKKTQVKVTTVGSDGSATAVGYTESVVQGNIVRVAVDFHSSAPNTTTVTIAEKHELVAQLIVNLGAGNTDINVYPAHVLEKNDGTDWLYTTGEEVPALFAVADILAVTVALSNALTNCVIVDIYYDETI